MERGDDPQVTLIREHLPGQVGAGGMRHGIVDVQQIELALARDLRHPDSQSQGVGGILEKGIAHDRHFVEADVGLEDVEPIGQGVGDKVHFVAARREAHPQFGGDGAAPAVGRIARDPDLHKG